MIGECGEEPESDVYCKLITIFVCPFIHKSDRNIPPNTQSTVQQLFIDNVYPALTLECAMDRVSTQTLHPPHSYLMAW